MARKFVKLGPVAKSFSDYTSDFKILKGQVKELETREQKLSKKIANAIRGGHLNVVSERDYEAYLESIGEVFEEKVVELSLEEKLEAMTKKELRAYYAQNFEVDEDEVQAFGKLKHTEMVTEILELDKEG